MDDYLGTPHTPGTQVIPVRFDDRTLYVEARPVGDGDEEVAGRLLEFEGFTEALSKVANTVTDAVQAGLTKVKPTKVTVEFGCEAGMESGRLTAILVKGTAKANLKVTMEWKPGDGD
ncbi:CU044_2847 family protein [Amycolatopsis sp. NPDC051128]|uniref:CU044_2847 family protein n=1 Tax=Amycolatopsis sp. NPDC051128 TaxID=3155412 RepID=UPI00342F4C2B